MQVSKQARLLQEGCAITVACLPKHHDPRIADRPPKGCQIAKIIATPVAPERHGLGVKGRGSGNGNEEADDKKTHG
jgi:hypothetical protein